MRSPSITSEVLQTFYPASNKFSVGLMECEARYSFDTPLVCAHFLAQIAHESGGFRYTKEIWGPTPPQYRYEGRKDLGNTEVGDGERFLGRGLIQITGRNNYGRVSMEIYGDDRLLLNPELLEEPHNAAVSAGWFFNECGAVKWARADNIERVTRCINGGKNGLDDRIHWLDLAKKALKIY